MIWPRKKDEKKDDKGKITKTINVGTFRVPLPPVRFDRGKCIIFINGKEELLDDEGFIIEIGVDDAKPIKIKIFPDFKNRKLDALEIIDINDTKEYARTPKLEFVGIGDISKEDIKKEVKKRIDIVEGLLNQLDEDQLKFNKKARRNSRVIIFFLSLILIYQIYSALLQTGLLRFIDIILIITDIIVIGINLRIINRANRIDKKIKSRSRDNKDEIEIIKEK